jgi:hypothetical protein
MNKILFHSNKLYNSKDLIPMPSKKMVPNWFSDASKYWKVNNKENEYLSD